MDRDQYSDETYTQPHVPPATAPVIDSRADPRDAITLANDNGDSDYSGTNQSDVDRGGEDDGISPADTPDEIVPDGGDEVEPPQPDEFEPQEGDIDEPGEGGDTVRPGATPAETLLPPD